TELATLLPRSGGQYVFARHALGNYAGFIVGWSDWLSTCGTTAAVSIIIGEYTGALFPALAGHTVAMAMAVAIGVATLEWRGVVWGRDIQNVTSSLKALAFLALVIACFLLGGRHSVTPAPVPAASWPTWVAVIVALQSVIYTYDGWAGVTYFSEEIRNPA